MFTSRPGLKKGEKIMVAMSGGVDSSAAVLLLQKAGYQPIGVTLRLWVDRPAQEKAAAQKQGCCSLDAVGEAREVAHTLKIPHLVLNMEAAFYEHVVRYFIAEYLRGRTPNPCLACNRYIKFSLLLQKARALGINYLATGHYARITYDYATKKYRLLKAADSNKDQSYLLFTLNQEQLPALIFPLGDLYKQEVRAIASGAGLGVASESESQEICFIPDHDYRSFLKRIHPRAFTPGEIFSVSGEKLGRHKGVALYTVGQRKGLGLSSPAPLYVVKIDVDNNALVVGEEKHTYSKGLVAEDVNFISGVPPAGFQKMELKIRYRAPFIPAFLARMTGSKIKIIFEKKQKAVTPGQAVVFYRGEEVLGGGLISASTP